MSNEQKPRVYVGSGKKVKQYDMVNITLCVTDIPKAEIYEYNGKKYLNLTIAAKRDGADQYGKTHSIWINDFKPDKEKSRPRTEKEDRAYDRKADAADPIDYPAEEMNPDDIPF